MQDSDKILTRLIGILKKLSNNEQPKVKELASYFSVTERTIQRDIYQRLLYFPIEKNKIGQLQFVNGFTLNHTVLDNDEILFTYLALCKLKEDNPHFEQKIHKILKKLLKPQHKILNSNSELNSMIEPVNKTIISKIEDAILQNRVLFVECTYNPITIKPYKLHEHNSRYTLIGEDCDDKQIKSIKLSRIKDVHLQKQKFRTKKSLDETLSNVHTAFFTAHHAKSFEAIINKEVAYTFIEQNILPSQEIIQYREDGAIEVRFKAENEHHVDLIVKQWMPHIRITKPENFNQTMIASMQSYINTCLFTPRIEN